MPPLVNQIGLLEKLAEQGAWVIVASPVEGDSQEEPDAGGGPTRCREAVRRVLNLMEHCKVGRVTMGETVRMWENCESFSTTLYMPGQEPSCFFTSGLLNGLFSVVQDRHVRESKCIAVGDPYCEWELRR